MLKPSLSCRQYFCLSLPGNLYLIKLCLSQLGNHHELLCEPHHQFNQNIVFVKFLNQGCENCVEPESLLSVSPQASRALVLLNKISQRLHPTDNGEMNVAHLNPEVTSSQ